MALTHMAPPLTGTCSAEVKAINGACNTCSLPGCDCVEWFQQYVEARVVVAVGTVSTTPFTSPGGAPACRPRAGLALPAAPRREVPR
eukprot:scaffold33496_cov41-Phaeocystis_antarctica.AAC.1